ncbi:MAG: hypothetical protein QXM93_06370 [Candidatus Methanomethyliaceae archaeon]
MKGRRQYLFVIPNFALGALWLVAGVMEGNFLRVILGLSFILVTFSMFLEHKFKDSETGRLLEILCLTLSFAIIVVGYLMSGTALLMVVSLFILGILALGLVLSYLIPKIRG